VIRDASPTLCETRPDRIGRSSRVSAFMGGSAVRHESPKAIATIAPASDKAHTRSSRAANVARPLGTPKRNLTCFMFFGQSSS
jgi:hypothetical protein